MTLSDALATIETDLRALADAERAFSMAGYMKHHFAFLGVQAPERKAVQKPLIVAARSADVEEILATAERCWSFEEREFQYIGCDLLRSQASQLGPEHLARVRQLIETKSWWDTVDSLAPHSVGAIVLRHPAMSAAMDEWVNDANFWVARAAILHQLTYKAETDAPQLFRYALLRGGDREFFIRKALGWALRSYARHAPDEVWNFVDANREKLSPLTVREATKHL